MMPTLDPNSIVPLLSSQNEINIFKKILGRNNKLKSSFNDKKDGEAYYVWRNVAFAISTNRQHHCMPVLADYYINLKKSDGKLDHDAIRTKTKELDLLVDKIISTVPYSQRHGINRWGKVFFG